MKKILCLFIALSFLFSCAKQDQKNFLVRVGKSNFSREQFEMFKEVHHMYPSRLNPYFPAQRPQISFMVETEAIYKKAKKDFPIKNIRSSADWQWKKRYYPAQVYSTDIIQKNLGFSETEIVQCYKTTIDSFKTIVKTDSVQKDSVTYKPLTEVKDQVAEILFRQNCKPDSAFLSKYGDSLPDSKTIAKEWLISAKSNLPDFFMRKYYMEKFNKPYPDSLSDILGKGKVITPEDIDVIMNWIPEERRSRYEDPGEKKELAEWLLKWKLFSEKAHSIGLASSPTVTFIMEWAWKMEVVNEYVKKRIIPPAQSSTSIDNAMALYSVYDDEGVSEKFPDRRIINKKAADLLESGTGLKVDSIIYNIRIANKIIFPQNDIKDEKTSTPAAIFSRADSLRNAKKVNDAERLYSTLAEEFLFTPEGKKALVELAKIQTERQQYKEAINNYRTYLLWDVDQAKKSTIFFMIGFIYDEYLNKPDLAEINYKWILKNAPDCELANDVEFMMLHLNEPMSNVEELQAEAFRQGKKIEPLKEDAQEAESAAVKKL